MEKYKVINHQKYEEYLSDNIKELGRYDQLDDAVEVATQIEENPNKWGLPNGVKSEIIQLISTRKSEGWVVVLHIPKDPEIEELEEVIKELEEADAKQTLNNISFHSEQRNNDLTKVDIQNDSFTLKKGSGKHPNSQKKLKPFTKGQSGNPSGRPVKYAQLKKMLDEFGNENYDDGLWNLSDTNREQVVKNIWHRASNGNRQDLDILLSLGLLSEDSFK